MQALDNYIYRAIVTSSRTAPLRQTNTYLGVGPRYMILPPYIRALVIDMKEDTFECPLSFVKSCIESKNEGYTSIIKPLLIPTGETIKNKKTLSSIFNFASRANGAVLTFNNNNICYYNNDDTIFDKDFKPIFSLSCIINYINNSRVELKKFVCRIPSSLFTSSKYLEKNILKKVVPFCATRLLLPTERTFLSNTTYGLYIDDSCCNGMQVIIDDFDITEGIVKPNISTFNSKSIREVLVNNIEKGWNNV